MKRNKLYLFTLNLSLLMTCLNINIVSSKVQAVSQDDAYVNNVSEAINKLIDSKNYTIEVTSKTGH